MPDFIIKTKGNSPSFGKRRVYFTCHSDDFERYFDVICNDIFATHDVAIYYTEDMSAPIAAGDKDVELGQANLFVVPVTYKLLTENNRAMDEDIAYAKIKKIPILPFVMENDLDVFYSKQDKFGELQYLSPFSSDETQISYRDKLKKILDSLLISDEMAKRVRDVFDAYIFLSYRKKDRKYANQLLKLIHENNRFRDVAVWYDEFLTPGESFKENIDRILHDSKLFALLVTPSLLERPNYVMEEEYPSALKLGMKILPIEMQKTDKAELSLDYNDIPDCVSASDISNFHAALGRMLPTVARAPSTDPLHNYLIGLAYFDGIDVETDRERGMKLFENASSGGLSEATYKLFTIYRDLDHTQNGAMRARVMLNKLIAQYTKEYGEEDERVLDARLELAKLDRRQGWYKQALERLLPLYEDCYLLFDEEHPRTLDALTLLATAYCDLGDHQKGLSLMEEAYNIRLRLLGEEHPDTLYTMNSYASINAKRGNVYEAMKMYEKAYEIRRRILGEEHPDTLSTLQNIATVYDKQQRFEDSLRICKEVYAARCRILGDSHIDTVLSLNNLVVAYGHSGQHEKEIELAMEAYEKAIGTLSSGHPYTISAKNNLAYAYGRNGLHDKAADMAEDSYESCRRIFGEKHHLTVAALNCLANEARKISDKVRAIAIFERVYTEFISLYGQDECETVWILAETGLAYKALGDYRNALLYSSRAAEGLIKIYGNESHWTVITVYEVAYAHLKLGNYKKAEELFYNLYVYYSTTGGKASDIAKAERGLNEARDILSRYKRDVNGYCTEYLSISSIYGKEHPRSLEMLEKIADTYDILGDDQTMLDDYYSLAGSYIRMYGNDHRLTVGAISKVAYGQGKLGNHKEAAKLYEAAFYSNVRNYGKDDKETKEMFRKYKEEEKLAAGGAEFPRLDSFKFYDDPNESYRNPLDAPPEIDGDEKARNDYMSGISSIFD